MKILSSRLPRLAWVVVHNALQLLGQRHPSYECLNQGRPFSEPTKDAEGQAGADRWAPLLSGLDLCQYLSRRLLASIGALTLIALILGGLLSLGRNVQRPIQAQKDHLFYLIVPSSHPDSELCKTLGTAAVLGYPTPYVLSWDTELDNPEMRSNRQDNKIHSMRDFLSSFGPGDDHMVLLLDGPYSWFQLRPEVLLKRYYSIIENANDKLVETFDRKGIIEGDIRLSVVFSAQDDRRRDTTDQPSCSIASTPRSSRHVHQDPKKLNVGSMMGPADALRALFDRAAAKAEHSSNTVEAQTIFEEIFSQQQVRRELARQRSWSKARRAWQSFAKMFGYGRTIIDAAPVRHLMDMDENVSYEFGIGVDYGNEIGLSVDRNLCGIEWTGNSTSPGSAGLPPPLPADIATSMPPFWTTSGYGMSSETGWEDVSLIVDEKTKSIPALINFRWDEATEPSTLQRSGWDNLWVRPHAQALYEAQQSLPKLPFASVVDGRGVEHVFWNPETRLERNGIHTTSGAWLEWANICDVEWTQKMLGTSSG